MLKWRWIQWTDNRQIRKKIVSLNGRIKFSLLWICRGWMSRLIWETLWDSQCKFDPSMLSFLTVLCYCDISSSHVADSSIQCTTRCCCCIVHVPCWVFCWNEHWLIKPFSNLAWRCFLKMHLIHQSGSLTGELLLMPVIALDEVINIDRPRVAMPISNPTFSFHLLLFSSSIPSKFSSQEHAVYGASCLLSPFPNPTVTLFQM